MGSFPPGTLLIVGGLLLPLLPHGLARVWMVALPALGLARLAGLEDGFVVGLFLFDYELEPVRVDALARVFGYVFYLAAFLSAIYALHVRDRMQHAAALVYMGSAIAAVFAGDLLSLFVFWELTAISSVLLIWASGTARAQGAGLRYLIVQVASGVLLLAGALWHFADTDSLRFGHLGLQDGATALIFLAFGVKAAFPLLHNWLQDAYPEATPTGTVFLSAFTTKLAIYALARGFAGTELLIPIGAAMTAFPIFYAVIENDLRRVLAYSLNNQLGFMVVGVGIGTEMALNGAAAHAFAHILYKGLLFMSMGAVLFRTGTVKGSELGGLYKTMPWTCIFCIVGAASISAFPLTSGFVSKSLILTAAAEEHHTWTFLVLLFASAGVFHHSGIKIPFFAFFAHDSGKRPEEATWNMRIAMAGAAFFCIALGVYPQPLYALLPYPVEFAPYTPTHVVTQLQLLLFSALAFGFLMRTGIYPPELRSTNLDTDWIYRRAAVRVVVTLRTPLARVMTSASNLTLLGRFLALSAIRRYHAPTGVLGEPWPTGTTAMGAAIALGACLLLYYL